jgi:hypothetical protein
LSLPYSPNAWPWRYRLGALLVHYAIRTLMHQAALDADRLSFTRSLDFARRQVTSQAAFPPWAAGQGDPAGGR